MSRVTQDHYLPLAVQPIIDMLCARTAESAERPCVQRLARMLEARFHLETHHILKQLRQHYDILDPDGRGAASGDRDAEISRAEIGGFIESIAEILRRANYRQLGWDEIEEAAAQVSTWGVRPKIDLTAFEHLVVFARGSGICSVKRRLTWQPWKTEDIEVHHYDRLVVAFVLKRGRRLHEQVRDTVVYLKLFKEIPHANVDTLLPTSAFQMSWWDRLRIALPTLSGLSLAAYKIVIGGIALAAAKLFGLLVLVGGMIGYGVRSFLGYLHTKDKYQLTLTRSLYYQNLDNNAGVLLRLLDEAEQQDLLETLLAYCVLRSAGPPGTTAEELDRQVESLIADFAHGPLDFEVDDALVKLRRLELAAPQEDGRWVAVPLDVACQCLSQQWSTLCDFDRDPRAAGAGDRESTSPGSQ